MEETRVLTFRKSLLLLLEAIPKWERIYDDEEKADRISINLADIEPLTYKDLKWIVKMAKQLIVRNLIGIYLVQEKSNPIEQSNFFLLLEEGAAEALSQWQSVDIKYLESPFLDEVIAVAKYIQAESSMINRRVVYLPHQITTHDQQSLSGYQLERALEYLEKCYCIRDLKLTREELLHSEVNEFKMTINNDLADLIKDGTHSKDKKANPVNSESEPTSNPNILTLSLHTNGTLVLNQVFKITKFSSELTPERVWKYLLDNPNKFVSSESVLEYYSNTSLKGKNDELEILAKGLKQELKKIIQQNKIKGKLFMAFFDERGKEVRLRNPVRKSDLQSLNISMIQIEAI